MEPRLESPPLQRLNDPQRDGKQDTTAVANLRDLLGKELRITIRDGRIFIGTFACTDKDLNIVLTSVYEFPINFQNDHMIENGRFVGMLMFPWRHVFKLEANTENTSSSPSEGYA